MSHPPRQFSPTVGTPPESLPHKRKRPPPDDAAEKDKDRATLAVPKIDMNRWEKKPVDIYRSLFGKEASIDHVTGRLLPAGP